MSDQEPFTNNRYEKNFSQLIKALEHSTIKDRPEFQVVKNSLSATYDDLYSDALKTTPTIDWSTTPDLLSLYEVTSMWEKDTYTFPRDKLYKILAPSVFEYVKGLKRDSDRIAITQLCSAANHEMVIGATSKRLRFDHESRCLVFIGKDKINWNLTLEKLKNFVLEMRYNKSQTKELLYELSSKYYPNMSQYYATLSLQELSNTLSSKDTPGHKLTPFLTPLQSLQREIAEPLNSVMEQAITLYKKLNDLPLSKLEPTDANFSDRLNVFAIDALSQFISDELRVKMRSHINHNCNWD